MAIVDEVRRELEKDQHHQGAFKKWLPASKLGVREIEVGSAASLTLSHLLNVNLPDKGRGELASIALTASDSGLTFVTHDHGAAKVALRELWMPGERLLGLAVFLRRLAEEGVLLNPGVLDEIMTQAGNPARPTWWASFRAGLAAS